VVASRSRYHHGNLRPALENAVLEIVLEHGVDAVTMAGAARLAGVSPSAPYRHFGSLDDLIGSTAAGCVERFKAAVNARLATDVPHNSEGTLLRLLPAFFEFAKQEPAAFALIFDSRSIAGARAIRPAMLQLFEQMKGWVATAVGRPPEECRGLTLIISGLALGQVRLFLADFSPLSGIDEAANVALDGIRILLDGYRANAGDATVMASSRTASV
jgi:AcrR family transcriptional regulator